MTDHQRKRVQDWGLMLLTAIGILGGAAAAMGAFYVHSATAAAIEPIRDEVTALKADDTARRDELHEIRQRLESVDGKVDRLVERLMPTDGQSRRR